MQYISLNHITMAHVIGPFFYGESNGAIFAVVTLMQICKICTFVKKYAAFCTFLNNYWLINPYKVTKIILLYVGIHIDHF